MVLPENGVEDRVQPIRLKKWRHTHVAMYIARICGFSEIIQTTTRLIQTGIDNSPLVIGSGGVIHKNMNEEKRWPPADSLV